jgi:hypothetical protein
MAAHREWAALACVLLLLAVASPARAGRLLMGEPDTPDAVPADGADEVLVSEVVNAAGLADQLLTRYLSNEELATWGTEFASRCSSIARKFSIGKSTKGVDLFVLEIAAKPGVADGKPNFRYVSDARELMAWCASFGLQARVPGSLAAACSSPLTPSGPALTRLANTHSRSHTAAVTRRSPTCTVTSPAAACCCPCWQSGCAPMQPPTRARAASFRACTW